MGSLKKKKYDLADYAFIISAICFFVALVLKINCPGEYMFYVTGIALDGVVLFYYIAEAALVGSIADWFAVTALFETPWICNLIPVKAVKEHTALLPKSKDNFIDNCGSMVEEEFLTKRSLLAVKKDVCFVDEVVGYLESDENRGKLEQLLCEFSEKTLKGFDTEKLSLRLESYAKSSLRDLDAKGKVLSIVKEILYKNRNEKMYDDFITIIHDRASSSSTRESIMDLIRKHFENESNKSITNKVKYWVAKSKLINIINEDELADEFHTACIATSKALKENTQLRKWFIDKTNESIKNMLKEPMWFKIIEDIQEEAIDNLSIHKNLKLVLDKLINEMCHPIEGMNDTGRSVTPIEMMVNSATNTLIDELKYNDVLRKDVECYLHHFSGLVILRMQSMVGGVIKTIMSEMSDEKLNDVVKSKIWIDLRNIRLNGTCIGGLIGGICYVVKCVVIA